MYKMATLEITDEVWDSYIETRDVYLRNRILNAYLYIVTVNAKRMNASCRNKEDLQEIVNQGVLALIDCIDKFDPKRSVQFDTYASIRVRGSIIDYIRKQDWVPRDVRKKFNDISNTFARMQSELNREPEDAEVAERLNMSVEELNRVTAQADGFSMLSFEELLQENPASIKNAETGILSPEQKLMQKERKEIITEAIGKLNEKEKLVISLYYFEGLKLKEVAALMDLTASRISQIHSKALMKLKKQIERYIKQG